MVGTVGNCTDIHEAANAPDWVNAHEALSRLAKARAAAEAEEGKWLLVALRSATHVHLGFATFAEYVERLFGYKPRTTQEKLRVAEALEQLPETAAALAKGALSWSAVREVTRVATRENECEWLQLAHGKSVRQLEQLVAGKMYGDSPNSPSRRENRRRVLHFEVAADTFATFRDAMAKLRRTINGPLDDDSALLLMARHVLGGPTDEGRSSYQLSLTVWAECKQGFQHGSGELIEVGEEVVAMANCDGQQLGSVENPTGTMTEPRPQATSARAAQNIRPSLRRAVLRRDGHCCVIPGCRNSIFVDIHHLLPRSEGGKHDADNVITLCSAHHRAQHRGQLQIHGSVSAGLTFHHSDGSCYGQFVAPRIVEMQNQAFNALRGLGFAEGEVRRVLATIRSQRELNTADTERIVREALALLTG